MINPIPNPKNPVNPVKELRDLSSMALAPGFASAEELAETLQQIPPDQESN